MFSCPFSLCGLSPPRCSTACSSDFRLFVSVVFAVVSNRAAIHLVHGFNEGENDSQLLVAIMRTQLLPCLVNRTEHIKSFVWNLLDDHATTIVGVAHSLHVASFFEPIYCSGNGSRGQTGQLSKPPGWHWPLTPWPSKPNFWKLYEKRPDGQMFEIPIPRADRSYVRSIPKAGI